VNTVPIELDDRFRAAAAADGLLDVAYDVLESPVGDLFVGVSDRGVCVISYDTDAEHQVERLARGFGSRVLRSPRPVEPTRRQLDEYFEGKRQRFDLAVDLGPQADFHRRVLRELARVPYGEVVTYGELAVLAGHPNAQRAAGTFCAHNRYPLILPCHRVVAANGLGSYGSLGTEYKRRLLELEGVAV